MIDRERANRIAQEWIDAWNSHDPERVVAHFADNVIVVSPMVEQLRPKSNGVLNSKRDVLDYYRDGLAASADLKFELVEVCAGVADMVIVYRNQRGVLVTEALEFDGDEVVAVRVAYGA